MKAAWKVVLTVVPKDATWVKSWAERKGDSLVDLMGEK